MANGTSPIPFDHSADVSFQGTPSPVAAIKNDYSNLEKGYSSAINDQPTVPQLTDRYNTQYGVPQLQQQVQNDQAQADSLNTDIANASKTIGQAAQQSIMTQGQKDAAVQAYTTPLQNRLQTLNTNIGREQSNLGTAQTNAGNMVQAEQTQQAKQLMPWTQAFKDQDVTSAMQMTGWTTENAQQLEVLLANQAAGKELTMNEQNNMERLAEQEQQFENSLKTLAATPMALTNNDIGIYQNGKITTGSVWG